MVVVDTLEMKVRPSEIVDTECIGTQQFKGTALELANQGWSLTRKEIVTVINS